MLANILWLLLLVLFAVVEAITVGLTSIWFAAGALCALVVSLITENVLIQVIVFLAVSCISLLLVRPLAQKYFVPRRVATNATDRIIGKEAVVSEDIDNLNATGAVRVAGMTWSARSQQDGAVIPKGAKVRILRIEGVKVFVAPVEPSAGEQQ